MITAPKPDRVEICRKCGGERKDCSVCRGEGVTYWNQVYPRLEDTIATYEKQIKQHEEMIHRVREEINRLRGQRELTA